VRDERSREQEFFLKQALTKIESGETSTPAPPATPSLTDALRFWLKLGFVSFGGPAGQIAIMHAELVERRRWISDRRFVHALNYCMLLPGPEAQQLATYIGWLLHKTRGALAAGLLFVLPSLAILMALSWAYLAFGKHPVAASVLWAIKPAVTAIVLHAAWRIGTRVLHTRALMAVAAAAFAAIYVFDVAFPLIIAAAAALGFAGARRWPQQFRASGAHTAKDGTHAPAVIDDDTLPPPHAAPSRVRLARVLAVAALLWLLPMAALFSAFDGGTLTQMAWFFTKAALLTFGGAYAVLPYVVQGAVEHYGWLTAAQMIDGLALGETTPGPLIMVVAFVGFLGGWQQQIFGAEALVAAGIAAACLVTYFTFLPSFVFILAGAPYVEATRHLPQIAAPLAAITAAVVGVIVNLALYFAEHVFWPDGFTGRFDWAAAAIGAGAAVALFRFKLGVMSLIGICAAIGLARGIFL
jgi:chromate transporter